MTPNELADIVFRAQYPGAPTGTQTMAEVERFFYHCNSGAETKNFWPTSNDPKKFSFGWMVHHPWYQFQRWGLRHPDVSAKHLEGLLIDLQYHRDNLDLILRVENGRLVDGYPMDPELAFDVPLRPKSAIVDSAYLHSGVPNPFLVGFLALVDALGGPDIAFGSAPLTPQCRYAQGLAKNANMVFAAQRAGSFPWGAQERRKFRYASVAELGALEILRYKLQQPIANASLRNLRIETDPVPDGGYEVKISGEDPKDPFGLTVQILAEELERDSIPISATILALRKPGSPWAYPMRHIGDVVIYGFMLNHALATKNNASP